MSADFPKFRPTSAAWAVISLLLGASPGLLAAPDVTATKDDGVAAAAKLPGGSVITYENTISNAGTSDATGVQFIDPEVANTAYVNGSLTATPVAIDDIYPFTVIANTSVNTATSGFSVITNDFAGYAGGVAVANSALTISNVTTPAHGTVTMTLSGAGVGRFIYTPTPGYTGADSFNYEISNGVTGGTTVSKTGTVNLTVGGPVIWFVDPALVTNGSGALGDPFNNLASAVTAIGANTNHRIFIYSGGSAQTTATVLNSGAWLVGQAAVGSTFEALMGGISYPGDTTAARPTINHLTKPTLTRSAGTTLTIGENNLILGVAVGNTGGGFAIAGNNINVGQIGNALTSDVDLSSGGSSSGVLSLNGGNGNIAINAPITASAGNSVVIANRSGGVVSFPKALTDNSRGISLTNNGVNATIAFSGGLALNTGAFSAFSATGGGKISATQNNSSIVNTIATSTGSGIVVTDTTIDTPGLTFRSIAADGAPNGISLNNTGTSAGLTVTGNGATNSGGIIQNTTGDGIVLNTTMNPSFDRMRIQDAGGQGISGLAVNGFSLTNTTIIGAGNADEENGMIFGSAIGADNGIIGTALIQDVVIDAPEQWGLRVRNAAAGTLNLTLRRVTVQNNTGTFGEDAVSIRIEGGSSNVLVDDCDFIDTGGKGVDGQCGGNTGASLHMTVQNTQFLRNLALPFATSFTTQGNASGRFLGSGNTATSSTTNITSSMAFDFDASDTSTLDATMTNNTANVTFGTGLEFVVNDHAQGRISASGNTINLDPGNVNAAAQQGMNFHARSVLTPSSIGELHVTLGSNTITGITSSLFGFAGINFQSGSSSGSHAQTISLNVSSSDGAGNNSVSGTAGSAFNLRQRTGTTFRVTGLATPGTVEGNVEAFIQTNNSSGTLGGASVVASAGGSTIVNYSSGATQTPLTPALPLMFAKGGIEKAPVVSAPTAMVKATSLVETVGLPETAVARETGIVTQAELDAVVTAAIARWEATGLNREQVARLQAMKFEIAALDGNRLGEASGETIRVDPDAGGSGWFVDASSASDALFGAVKSPTRRYTEPSAMPAGRVDLLTTLMHEMGHALGLPDSYHTADRDCIMYGHLSKGERRLPAVGQAKDAKPFSGHASHFLTGALNPIDIGTLPPGKSVVIAYQVEINDPFTLGATQVSSQGTVHSTTASFTDVLTDDPESGAVADATITLLDRPDTSVVSIARATSTPSNGASLSWTVTLADSAINLVAGNFTLATSGLGGTPAITGVTAIGGLPATQWTVTASTGTGDGTLGLNLTNDAGLSHDITNLPFTGEIYTIDRSGPTSTVVVADSALAAGETSLVTITFNEVPTGFDNADLSIANGTLSSVSSTDGGITWTAILMPTGGITDATNVITLDNTGVTDALGNPGTGTTDSNNYAIDTGLPTATILVADDALTVGETSLVTITFSEAVTGFTNADLSIANGSLSSVSSADGGITWTATFTPAAGIADATNVITLDNTGVADAAGNAGSGTTDSNNYAIDTARPTATVVVADSALAADETSLVTITFSEAVTGFDNADLAIANGSLSPVSSSDGGITWTATFTPTPDITDASNIITLDNSGVTDALGNAGTGTTDSNNYVIDTARPTATIVLADVALAAGETSLVTITFSEAVTGLTNADLTIDNGSLNSVSSSDGGITWSATLTPTSGVTDASNLITLDNTGVTDAAGNTGTGTTDSNNYAIDTARPTATIVVADTELMLGETSLVTITFSEAVSGFANADLTIPNGTLSPVSSGDGGITWTATFTPTPNVNDATNVITLDNTGVIDVAGNAGTGTTDSNNFAITSLSISIAADSASVAEGTGGGNTDFTFTVSRTGGTSGDVTVDYAVTGAADAADFGGTLPSDTVTIPDGQISAILTINVDQDSTVEPDEDFTVTLSNPSGGYVLTSDSAVSTIANDDSATLVVAKVSDGAESDTPSDGLFRITQSAASSTDTIISYTVGGSASSGSDFTALSGSAMILAGSTTADITVPVLGDDLVESTETVSITLTTITAGHPAVTLGSTLDASLDITDDDSATVTIAKIADGAETASPTNGLFRVTQSAISSSDTIVTYTVGGSASSGSDFTALSGSVTITAGATTADIVLTVLNDAIVEATESVGITLTGFTSGDADVSLGATVLASADITDDDTATVSIAKLNDGAESNTPIDGVFRISQTASSSTDTLVSITISGIATSGEDFTDPVAIAIISAGSTFVDLIIPVLNDNFIEPTESVTATLFSLGSHNPGVSIAAAPDNSASLDITDDDVAASIAVSSGSGQSATVNTAFSDPLVAIVEDAGGVPMGGASVTFTANGVTANGSFAASATVVSDADGLATAPTLTANTISGTYTVSAATPGVVTPASFTLTNTSGDATQFFVSAPANAIAGEAFNVTVTAADAFGNTATAYPGTVQVSSSDPAAILPADSSLIAGVGTFSVNLVTGGNQTVTATDDTNALIVGISSAINVSPRADLAVTLSDSPDPVNAAGSLTYTMNVTNIGPSTAVAPSLTLPLPAGTTFVSATAPLGWVTTSPAVGAGGTVGFSASSLDSGDSADFTVIAQVDLNIVNDTILATTATTVSTTTDPNAANNSATTTTLAKSGADLQLSVTDSPDPVVAGTELTYTIEVGNNGPLDAENVSISDTLPTGTTFVSLSAPVGWNAVTPAVGDAGSITISNPLFANAGSATFTLVVKVGSDVANGTLLSKTATIGSTVIDIAPGNNSASVETTVTTQSDLAIQITATPETAPKGSDVTYQIIVTNDGPSDASAPEVSMPIPANMTFVSATTPGGWIAVTPVPGSGGTVTFSASSLANGATETFTVVARVDVNAPTGTVLTATATASAAGVDPVVANNSASATSAVGTVDATALQIGTTGTLNSQSGLFELTVTVTNTTPLPINGFRLHVDFSAYLAAYPSLRLYNATSPAGGADVYVDYPYPVALDGVVPVKLTFYTSTRTFPDPFAPVLSVETLASSQVPDTNGSGVQPRIVMLPDGNILLEFSSVAGQWYRVRYSSDMVNWSDCPVPIQASTNRMQWIDSGAPFTNVPPSEVPSRFYTVNEIAAP